MAPTYDIIKAHMTPWEGNVRYMYLDTKGKVTVGIGNMLPNVAAAQKLSFVNATTKNPATADEIKTDFDTITSKEKAKKAAFYKEFTTVELPETVIDTLFRARIAEFLKSLKSIYKSYDDYPDEVQLALLDMIFNLGPAGLEKKWPKLNKNIDDKDWAAAATNSNRPDVQPGRNLAVKNLFEKAGEDAKAAAEKK